MTKKIKTAQVHKTDYSNYFKKAVESHDTMLDSLSKGKWNAVGLNAIHSGISAVDAMLVFFCGVRSASPKHDDIIKLATSLLPFRDTKDNMPHLRSLIYMKNIVAYEIRLIGKDEALALSKHASRFLEWAKTKLPAV